MDAVVHGALEEICSQGVNGLTLHALWSKIHSHLSRNSLHLCPNVKRALWSNLLSISSLQFKVNGVLYDAEDPKIQSFEDSEAMDLKIVATEHLLNGFVGIYDIKASDAGVSQPQRRVLERLAIARTDGVTQNELAKDFGIKNNNMYYIIRNLETRGLIVSQSTIIRKKEAGNEGEYKQGSIVNTNMLHLYRYAKHLGHLQRIEITKEDKAFNDNGNADREAARGVDVSEDQIKEGIHIKDYSPDLKAICDRLEKAERKVLVTSDIKKELGYRNTSGHRAWRNILHRLKDAHLVEEFFATVNDKEVSCIRLLKSFSPETCVPRNHDDELDTEQHVKAVKRGQITEQVVELPIEQQIYDMIDAEGSKGLTLNEVYKRLGINNKRYYPRILDMKSRYGMHLDSESLNRGVVYRVWTCGNYHSGGSNTNTPSGNIRETINVEFSTQARAGQLMLTHIIGDADVDAEPSEEQNPNSTTALHDVSCNGTPVSSNDLERVLEPQIVNVKPVSHSVSLETSSAASPARRRRRSYTTYPCIGLNSVNLQREQRILEKLLEEKVLIKPELHRLLESLENSEKKQHTMMDKKTLERSLNKLQEEGHCKCISFAVPSVTNCGRKRTVDVILHPSVYKAQDLSDRVHDKLRSFEKQIRNESFSKYKSRKGKPIPVLNDVERISTSVRIDPQSEAFEAMKSNGFVLAKMVRAKLLHMFLWGYLTGLPDWDDAIFGKNGYEQKNPHSTCKLVELDPAIKAMPLELFLQVAGSTLQPESMVEKCRNGLCLSDLPIQEYRCLMDTRATARLSNLIDILRRLKLIRLIGGELVEAPVGPHATLRHSLEFKPYIEEPVGMVLRSTCANSSDLRPHVRHDFVLSSKKSVDEYWNTLEYCYAASNPKAALHSFPGSAVHEVFLSRSWASARVMTADQRAELSKLVVNEDPDQKISYKKCEKIAESLNLTLEQVLRVFYDKRQKNKLKGAASTKVLELQPPTPASLSNKRKRSLKGKPVNNDKTLMKNELDEEMGKVIRAKMFAEDTTEEQQSSLHEILINEIDSQKGAVDDLELIEDENGSPSAKLHGSRSKRFAWTDNSDRLLVIEYVKYRSALGKNFHRVDWGSIQSLPAPPNTCRRRISTLNRNKQFRKAVLRLCNMLSVRFAKHLENSKNKPGENCRMVIQDQNAPHHTSDLNIEERWDDFDNIDIKMVLDEVLKYKHVAKLEACKGGQYISKYPQSDVWAECELDEKLGSSATTTNELKDGEKKQVSARRSRRRLPKSYVMLMNKVNDFGTKAYKSLAVSNAIELFKLIFLITAKDPEVPNLLAETLRRYSEHDLFTAFNYIRDKNFMVRGSDIGHFVLSQQFLHNISSSPFPVDTGRRAVKMAKWLQERENDLLDTGVDLSADLQCGDVLQLCVLMCSGEISMFPCLPDKGVGEIEDSKKRKSDDNVENAKKQKLSESEIGFRKEKGFPGIQLSLNRSLISRIDAVPLSRDDNAITSSSSNLEYNSLCSQGISKSNVASESTWGTWEAMTCHAKYLASSSGQEPSPFPPNLFKNVYSAIQKAGDQGLSMEEISQITDVPGMQVITCRGETMTELIVEVLEAFGRAFKVHAYDSIHVVDSLYRSKYLLISKVSFQHDLDPKLPENSTNDGEKLELQQENHEDKEKNLLKETCRDLVEVHTITDEVQHRVTILNHPEEGPQQMSEVENAEVMSLRRDPHEEMSGFRICDSSASYKPILPWLHGDGTINDVIYKGLVRRVLGIVMQHPGILEEHIIRQMNVLNPQSCRKLLELMIRDSHITVRKMYQSVSNEPPAMLRRLLGCRVKKPELVCREHLFANPRSINNL